MSNKSGRWGHRPRQSAAVGVLTNRKMGSNTVFKQVLRDKNIFQKKN